MTDKLEKLKAQNKADRKKVEERVVEKCFTSYNKKIMGMQLRNQKELRNMAV